MARAEYNTVNFDEMVLFGIALKCLNQGRIIKCGGPGRKVFLVPTHMIKLKGQMTVFCSILVNC